MDVNTAISGWKKTFSTISLTIFYTIFGATVLFSACSKHAGTSALPTTAFSRDSKTLGSAIRYTDVKTGIPLFLK
jgi:hypothetical protein